MNLAALRLANIRHKLEWSANSEWSAHITPEECALLLRELEKPRRTGRILHGDNLAPEAPTKPKRRGNARTRERRA